MHDLNASHQPSTIHNSQALWHVLLALLFLLAVFTSCHKAEDDPAPKVPRIKTITTHMGSKISSISYEYDALGRVSKVNYPDRYDEYEYQTGKIILKYSVADFSPNPDTLLLNDQSLVISQLLGTNAHQYAADGKMIKTIFYNPDGKVGSEYGYETADGNTTSCNIWDMNPKKPLLLITYEYAYLPNSANTIGIENMGMSFFGKQDKNLMSIMKRTMIRTSDLIEEHYLYETDVQNRVVKKWKEGDPGNYNVYTYYYEIYNQTI